MIVGFILMKLISKVATGKALGMGLRCDIVNVPGAQRGGWAFVSKLHSTQGIDLNAQFVKLPEKPSTHAVRIEYWYNFCWPEAQRLIDMYWPPNAEKMTVLRNLQQEQFPQPIAVVEVTKDVKKFRRPSIHTMNETDDPAVVLAEIAEDVRKVADAELIGLCEPRRLALAIANDANVLGITGIPIRVAAALACAKLKLELAEFAKAELEKLHARLPETISAYSLQNHYFDALIESIGGDQV